MADQQKINQLQLYEQSLQNILQQKQQFQSQISEVNSALKELETSSQSYKIIGNIMVDSKKDDLKKELDSKRSAFKLRVEKIEKQESTIKEKMQSLQSELMKDMGKSDKDESAK